MCNSVSILTLVHCVCAAQAPRLDGLTHQTRWGSRLSHTQYGTAVNVHGSTEKVHSVEVLAPVLAANNKSVPLDNHHTAQRSGRNSVVNPDVLGKKSVRAICLLSTSSKQYTMGPR